MGAARTCFDGGVPSLQKAMVLKAGQTILILEVRGYSMLWQVKSPEAQKGIDAIDA
jgi:hypothetical protein